MKNTLLLWKLEWKHTLKLLPGMLLEAILIVSLLVAVAFGAGKFFYRDKPLIQITIAVVEEEENPMTELMLQYLQNMESISENCQFQVMGEAEAFGLLQEQKVAAVLVLPSQLVEGILNGENTPVQIYFPENAGMESALLKELTDAGVGMLRVAQAEIYGIYDTAEKFDALEKLSMLEADINQKNLAFALDRMALFQEKNVSATDGLTLMQYYTASGMIFALLLLGMACYPMMQPYTKVMSGQLFRQGIGMMKQCFGKWMCGFGSLSIGFVAIGIILRLPKFGWYQIGVSLLILLCVTTFVFFIFQLADNGVTAILALFFLSTIMVYCSGGFVPTVFLPETIQHIGRFLPTTYLIQAAGSLYTNTIGSVGVGRMNVPVNYILLGYAVVFWGCSYVVSERSAR
ncbi:MAG: ABC transporter permease [Lachnospiraceae bacterium]|nr:ABC transporter permease [Lachnospiraceae bacterium]